MKGVILAAGRGSRLYPLTKIVNKQLLQIYDKPMIYYPLSTLMLLDVKDIMIICSNHSLDAFKTLLGGGSKFGLNIDYAIQEKPNGIADAFLIAEDFIGDDNSILILGDNIFYGHGFLEPIRKNISNFEDGAIVFGYSVKDPERYGVVEFDKDRKVLSLEEKPKFPKSNYAIPGLYIYDNKVCEYAKKLSPSLRGEYEITDLNKIYLSNNKLKVNLLGRGVAWLDTGTPESMIEASTFISYIESRQGLKIACLEEVSFNRGFINKNQLLNIVNEMPDSSYKDYLKNFTLTI